MPADEETPTQLDPLSGQAYAKVLEADSTVRDARATSGKLRQFYVDNRQNSIDVFIKFFDAASGSVTLGTTVPLVVWRIDARDEAEVLIPVGWTLASALSYACVTTGGTTGTTSPPAPVVARVRTTS